MFRAFHTLRRSSQAMILQDSTLPTWPGVCSSGTGAPPGLVSSAWPAGGACTISPLAAGISSSSPCSSDTSIVPAGMADTLVATGAHTSPLSTKSSEPQPRHARSKSLKRQAAEALLAARFGSCSPTALSASLHTPSPSAFASLHSNAQLFCCVSSRGGSSAGCSCKSISNEMHDSFGRPSKRRHSTASAGTGAGQAGAGQVAAAASKAVAVRAAGSVVSIAACPPSCACKLGSGWCHFDVKMPYINWQSVFDASPTGYTTFGIDRGYDKVHMNEGLQVYVVEQPRHMEAALAKLRASMQDPVIAIDLEWRPETSPGQFSPVAMLQLSSANVCLIIRTSAMQFSLPEPVKAFLSEPQIVIVGFSWDGSDEAKLTRSFSFGKSVFKQFYDLQSIAHELGYNRHGLARLTKQVMGFSLQKTKTISRSNWAAHKLTMHQIKYAALDVFAAGQVFRGLRLWHSSPSPCSSCRQDLGSMLPQTSPVTCSGCDGKFDDWNTYYSHCMARGHPVTYMPCSACGRLHGVEPKQVSPPPADEAVAAVAAVAGAVATPVAATVAAAAQAMATVSKAPAAAGSGALYQQPSAAAVQSAAQTGGPKQPPNTASAQPGTASSAMAGGRASDAKNAGGAAGSAQQAAAATSIAGAQLTAAPRSTVKQRETATVQKAVVGGKVAMAGVSAAARGTKQVVAGR